MTPASELSLSGIFTKMYISSTPYQTVCDQFSQILDKFYRNIQCDSCNAVMCLLRAAKYHQKSFDTKSDCHHKPRSIIINMIITKPTKWPVRPAKTKISLGIRPVWSESSLCAQWVAKDPSFLHADSEDSEQTGWMPMLIWVLAGWQLIL